MKGVNQIYCDYFTIYTYLELCCIPEINVICQLSSIMYFEKTILVCSFKLSIDIAVIFKKHFVVGHIRDDVYLTKADTQDNKHNPSEWLNRLLEASLVFEGSIFLSERTDSPGATP